MVARMTAISAQASRDGQFWLVYVPEVDQYTQGRTITEAKAMACDLAATILEVPVEDIVLDHFEIDVPPSVRAELDRAEHLREKAQRTNRAAATALRAAAQQLRDRGLTVRDIGATLEVSHQRASQLLAGDSESPRENSGAARRHQ